MKINFYKHVCMLILCLFSSHAYMYAYTNLQFLSEIFSYFHEHLGLKHDLFSFHCIFHISRGKGMHFHSNRCNIKQFICSKDKLTSLFDILSLFPENLDFACVCGWARACTYLEKLNEYIFSLKVLIGP